MHAATSMTLTDAEGALELVCTKCTRFALFPAKDRREAYMRAALKGWTQRVDKLEKRVIATQCPQCSGNREIKINV
jgi:hypothetical protein